VVEGWPLISVCFRFDDPSPIGDRGVECRILESFSRRHIPLCVATIPFARAADGTTILLSRQNAGHLIEAAREETIEIAQHGHSHLRARATDRGAPSEFFGIPFEEQYRLITEGQAHLAALFERRIKGFVPPWNSYDGSTLRAVFMAGFEFLSAGLEIVKPGTLPIVPATCALHNVRRALECAWYFQALAPLLVVVLHPDDFKEFKLPPLHDDAPASTSLPELEALLDWIRNSSWIRTEALGRIAESVRNGTPLCNPQGLKLPYRVKALVPPMLTRSDAWATGPRILWGAFRSRSRPWVGRRTIPAGP
jgi:peptidoglycan/xylan/chitin deacetylase (PgdA/CDA1 family)